MALSAELFGHDGYFSNPQLTFLQLAEFHIVNFEFIAHDYSRRYKAHLN
jgi:hypothetical protein